MPLLLLAGDLQGEVRCCERGRGALGLASASLGRPILGGRPTGLLRVPLQTTDVGRTAHKGPS
jgi:hypothetical protein